MKKLGTKEFTCSVAANKSKAKGAMVVQNYSITLGIEYYTLPKSQHPDFEDAPARRAERYVAQVFLEGDDKVFDEKTFNTDRDLKGELTQFEEDVSRNIMRWMERQEIPTIDDFLNDRGYAKK